MLLGEWEGLFASGKCLKKLTGEHTTVVAVFLLRCILQCRVRNSLARDIRGHELTSTM